MMCKNIIKVLIAIVAILYILQVYGVNTSALVAGVGAFSLVIGLAFQDVLKDLLVGATIILESQFAIGEIVEINGFKGEVISLTLKTTISSIFIFCSDKIDKNSIPAILVAPITANFFILI